jgi:uncharacterized protein (DUF1501 family)
VKPDAQLPPGTIDRRRFLASAALCVGVGATAAVGARWVRGRATGCPCLVRVELRGGNDGLNTLAPYRDLAYRRSRPTLALDGDELIGVEPGLGLHPALAPLIPLWKAGEMAIVPSVGAPIADRSHFFQRRVWSSGDPTGGRREGWLGRLLAEERPASSELLVSVGDEPHAELTCDRTAPLVLNRLEELSLRPELDGLLERGALEASMAHSPSEQARATLRALEFARRVGGRLAPRESTPDRLSRRLDLVADMLAAGWEGEVFTVVLDGFDTHVMQRYTHHLLLLEFAEAVAAFFERIKSEAPQRNVLLVANSEFGRRIGQNGADGTDHGLAGPVFAFGPRVVGGIHGPPPDLEDHDQGDLKPRIDFRSVLAECARHLDLDAGRVLDGRAQAAGFLS